VQPGQTGTEDIGEAPLDLTVTDAASGTTRRVPPGSSGVTFLVALARRTRRMASRAAGMLAEYARIAAGASTLTPSARDHRFADIARTQNPLRRRVPTPGRRARRLRAGPSMSSVRMVSVGRRRLRVAVRPGTDPGRPPLLLCSGIGASLELLEPFVDEVDPAIEVIRFDPPGVGESPVSPLPYPFIGLARLVRRMLDTLGYHRFDVLGVSWGGGLAQQLAFQNPRRCRRLVLVATATGCLMVPASPRTLLRMATPRRYWDADYARSIAGHIYGGTLRSRPELVQQLILDFERPSSRRGYIYQLAAGAGWTSLPFLPLIRQPTLILAGDDDPIIPLVNARIMAKLLPAAQLEVYPDGHLGLVTMKAELAKLVSDFVGRP
jgi:poly(3-hydroxyalkanoate) depolymerase